MFTCAILGILFMAWLILSAAFFVIGCVYGCMFAVIDLILMSPFILIATPFVITAAIIAIILICKKVNTKKKNIRITYDVIE